MNFQDLLSKSSVIQGETVSPASRKTYEALLNKCRFTMPNIPGAPDAFPLSEEKLRVFITYYINTHPNTTYKYMHNFVSAVVYHVNKENEVDFTKSASFKNFLKGLRNKMKSDNSPHAKSPVTKEIMGKLADLSENDETKTEVMTLMSFLYFGFLLISEAVNMTFRNIGFDEERRMIIFIPYSKTDQIGRGETIYMSPNTEKYSVFKWFAVYCEKYIDISHEKRSFHRVSRLIET